MARVSQAYDDQFDDQRDQQRQSRRDASVSPPKFKQSPRPKRTGAAVSFNGLHRRRKKRIQW